MTTDRIKTLLEMMPGLSLASLRFHPEFRHISIISGDNVSISFTADAGSAYQVQSTTDLSGSPIVWTNEGTPLSGTGTVTYNASNGGGAKFFRVVCQ